MSMFATPTPPGSGIKFDDHNGALLLFDVIGVETGIQTAYGESDAVKANIAVLDGAGAPENYPEALVFPKLLQSQLKGQVGSKVLGRLGQGNKKPGQSPPWLLNEASTDDVALAEKWVRDNQPATTTPAAPF